MPAKVLTRLSVDYNLTEHCNLSCYGCDHASPLLAQKFAAVEEFSRDLEALARVFHATELRIVGGEPLLHPQLLQFLEEGRRIGIADRTVLFTNGVLLHQMSGEFWRLIDELKISAYPGVRRRLDDGECARLCREHGVKLEIRPLPEFSKTLVNDRIEDAKLVGAIFRECAMARTSHSVHEGRFYKCCVAPFTPSRLAQRGVDFAHAAADSVALHDNPNLYAELDRYISAGRPLGACAYCFGSSGPSVAHRQLNRSGCEAWLAENDQADIEAVGARLLGRPRLRAGLDRLRRLLHS